MTPITYHELREIERINQRRRLLGDVLAFAIMAVVISLAMFA